MTRHARLTPKSAGFSMPAEWAPHARTWMMWPSRPEVWDDMAATCRAYTAVAHAIRDCEPLTMLVRPEDAATARAMLGADIDLLEAPIDDSWARDAGPCFLVNAAGERAGVSFRFNAWGGKYHPHDGDDAAGSVILDAAGVRAFASDLVAEGGGIAVDGEGTILTTESCFPNANRNPDWTRDAIESELKEMLGGDKVIWLPGNALETETDGHVDGIAAFVAPGVVMVEALTPDAGEWHRIAEDNIAALTGQTDARGRPITLVRIPEASDADSGGHDDRFCRSYVNSYICNDAVIMPEYGIRTDDEVREIFEGLFPARRILGVPVSAIAIGGGGIHCITQQEPAGRG
ncbi:agmatine deiminase family protein [Roseovarius sp. SCSIO 43702]|uniref:agmatine deiminase family protein n=1 Tax=Roseovarius sp. SCSIO 43702 TaxID=2823043 RepID=UPI001C72BCE1|nr:agmatine deiminase family protein [Roseovarius sp. SCSIO 43702]QYX56559.1 agmatine deiminase family protein [Roseovarius sp. SCSIO 43702]